MILASISVFRKFTHARFGLTNIALRNVEDRSIVLFALKIILIVVVIDYLLNPIITGEFGERCFSFALSTRILECKLCLFADLVF